MSVSQRGLKPWVYIASPYTKGDAAINVRAQLVAFDALLDLGVIPVAPLFSHFQHLFLPRDYRDWIELDLEVIQRCDACLRLAAVAEVKNGKPYHQWESSGADGEVAEFFRLGRPVFESLDEIREWLASRPQRSAEGEP